SPRTHARFRKRGKTGSRGCSPQRRSVGIGTHGELARILQVGNLGACGKRLRRIDFSNDNARFVMRGLGKYSAPWVDDQRMAVGLAAVLMHAPLRGRDDESAVFDGARAQQDMPVRLAGL